MSYSAAAEMEKRKDIEKAWEEIRELLLKRGVIMVKQSERRFLLIVVELGCALYGAMSDTKGYLRGRIELRGTYPEIQERMKELAITIPEELVRRIRR